MLINDESENLINLSKKVVEDLETVLKVFKKLGFGFCGTVRVFA